MQRTPNQIADEVLQKKALGLTLFPINDNENGGKLHSFFKVNNNLYLHNDTNNNRVISMELGEPCVQNGQTSRDIKFKTVKPDGTDVEEGVLPHCNAQDAETMFKILAHDRTRVNLALAGKGNLKKKLVDTAEIAQQNALKVPAPTANYLQFFKVPEAIKPDAIKENFNKAIVDMIRISTHIGAWTGLGLLVFGMATGPLAGLCIGINLFALVLKGAVSDDDIIKFGSKMCVALHNGVELAKDLSRTHAYNKVNKDIWKNPKALTSAEKLAIKDNCNALDAQILGMQSAPQQINANTTGNISNGTLKSFQAASSPKTNAATVANLA